MASDMRTLVVPVKDVDRAKALFTSLLGTGPTTDESYYVGYSLDGLEVGLDPNGHSRGMTGPVPYWDVEDIGAVVDGLVEAGAEVRQAVQDVGGGNLIATVADADGNVIGLRQPA